MKYTSKNGCFFYYDRDTYSWELCEPTLMFLLGFEAITTFDKARSDHLVISNKIYNTVTGELDDMPDFQIYDEAISYLASLGPVEDGEYYAQYNCYGLKLLLNELTGTGTDRTVPVIFLNDINRKLVDPNKYPYADKAGKSYYDLQSTLILNVFKYAGYDLLDNEITTISEGTAGVNVYNLLDDNVPPRLDEIVAYNSSISTLHEEKQAAGQVYKLLDYKAMYLYALGVLYGLRSMGYDRRMIWRIDPTYWYFDKYQNLVKTAWAVFRFHYSHPIYELDTEEALVNKYKDIQYNKLWNFMNGETSTSDVQLYNNEVFAYAVYVNEVDASNFDVLNRIKVKSIVYLYPTDNDLREGSKGKYIEYVNDESNPHWTEPESVESLISSSYPLKGVIAADSDTYTRYIAHNKVNIKKALRYTRNIQDPNNSESMMLPKYLSPNSDVKVTIPEGTSLAVDETLGKFYHVTYTDENNNTYSGWINSIYTDKGEFTEPELNDGDFLLEPFEVDSGATVKTLSDIPLRELSGNDYSYFISTGNFGWTDFDLTYWKKFKKYVKSNYDQLDSGDYYCSLDAENSSVLTMVERNFTDLFPQRIGNAFSLVDCTAVSYYKCNVTDSSYLYGIFDCDVVTDSKTGELSFLSFTDGKKIENKFKYILSELDFNKSYTSSEPDSDFVKKTYYDIATPVLIYVYDTHDPKLIWDGISEHGTRLDAYGYTPTPSSAIDAYYYIGYRGELFINEIRQYEIRSYNFGDGYKYWSHNFEKQSDTTYGEYIEWVSKNSSIIVTEDNLPVHATTGDTVTLYRNVRKLFDNTPYYYKLDYVDSFEDYICNTNESYTEEFGKFFDGESYKDNMPLGFVRYQDLHDRLGITTHLCPVIETDQNGDSLVVNGTPYVWYDEDGDSYWNGFTNEWQSTIPVRRNAVMYNSTTNELIKITDDTINHTVTVVDGEILTYEEFYVQYPTCGILRSHTVRVFGTNYQDEGIIDCYYDTKLSDNEDDHIICVLDPSTGECRVPWVSRSDLKNYSYWIVDGTASLYNGEEVTSTVYDDDHRD